MALRAALRGVRAAATGIRKIHGGTLESRSVVSLCGQDTEKFLQGVMTNDITALQAGSTMYAGFLNAQGRLLYDAFLHKRAENDILADVEASKVGEVTRYLRKFKLRAKVTIEDASAEKAVAWSTDETGSQESLGPDPRLSLLGQRGIVQRDGDWSPATEEHRALRMNLGVGEGEEMEGEVPLECNFDGLNGVSFTKGCYVGQELIARTHYRGTVRKRLVPVTIEGERGDSIERGASLSRQEGRGRPPGRMIASHGGLGLALLRLNNLGDSLVVDCSGGTAKVVPHQPSWWPSDFLQPLREEAG